MQDPEEAVKLAASPLARRLWTIGGVIAVGLGIAGAVLPLLPATPFFLLAAFCFARGSRRLHAWILNHRWIGPPIRRWRRDRTVSVRTKWVVVASLAVMLPPTFWFAPSDWLRLGLGTGALIGLIVLYAWPSRVAAGERGRCPVAAELEGASRNEVEPLPADC